MKIVWPTESQRMDFLHALESGVWREVEFIELLSVSGCPNPQCSLNPVTDTSTNSFCPICSGLYWIPFYSGYDINAHVTWRESEQLNWYSAGQQFVGDVNVKIIYTDETYDMVRNTKHVLVDDREMEITKVTLLGAPTINRILVALIEVDKEN